MCLNREFKISEDTPKALIKYVINDNVAGVYWNLACKQYSVIIGAWTFDIHIQVPIYLEAYLPT